MFMSTLACVCMNMQDRGKLDPYLSIASPYFFEASSLMFLGAQLPWALPPVSIHILSIGIIGTSYSVFYGP